MKIIKKNLDIILIFFSFAVLFLLIIFYLPRNISVEKKLLNKNYKSPELNGLTNWINSEEIPSIASLRGKVVLVDFWTYSCINCIRSLPSLQKLQKKYADDGLVILGIHSPEFSFEKIPENVLEESKKYGLTYPIAQDNNFKTWKNFKNRYWPAKYIIDKNGYVRYTHFGEGAYEITEKVVIKLLGIEKEGENLKNKEKINYEKSPETYLGTDRRTRFLGKNSKKKLKENEWKISGIWMENEEKIFSNNLKDEIFLEMKILGKEANLVMGGNAKVEIFIDEKFFKTLIIKKNSLYNIFDFKNKENKKNIHNIKLKFSGKNIELFAWTFG